MGIVLMAISGILWIWMIFHFIAERSFEDTPWTFVVFLGPIGGFVYFVAYYLPGRAQESGSRASYNRFKRLRAFPEDQLLPADFAELGDYLFSVGEWDKAAAYYEKALAGMPARHSMRVSYADCLARMNRHADAIEALRQVPRDAAVYGERAAYHSGKYRAASGDWAGALADYETVAKTGGTSEFKFDYASALARNGRAEDARRVYAEIVRFAENGTKKEKAWARKARAEMSNLK